MMQPDKLFAYRGVDGDWHAHKKAGRLQFYCAIIGCKNRPGDFYYERRMLNLHRREKHGELALSDVKLKEPNPKTKYSRARYEREKNDNCKWLDMLSKNHRRRLENQACSKEGVKNKLMLSDIAKVEIDEKMLVYDSEESQQERIRKRDECETRRSQNPVQAKFAIEEQVLPLETKQVVMEEKMLPLETEQVAETLLLLHQGLNCINGVDSYYNQESEGSAKEKSYESSVDNQQILSCSK